MRPPKADKDRLVLITSGEYRGRFGQVQETRLLWTRRKMRNGITVSVQEWAYIIRVFALPFKPDTEDLKAYKAGGFTTDMSKAEMYKKQRRRKSKNA